ncbi:MAG TPA: NAD(P)-binding domain-containing protein, partial [Candidatus Binatus sp.]|nr:NAD(P)-binding domain-containing protein [Candidatus Binatus sp.]
METFGFVGLGTIGGVIAKNIQKAGYGLVVHDVRLAAVKPLVDGGAGYAASPAQVARECAVVFTSLPGPAEVEQVALGPNGLVHGLHEGSIYVDLSSSSADLIRRIGAEFASHGAR